MYVAVVTPGWLMSFVRGRHAHQTLPPGVPAGLLERAARATPAVVEASANGWWLRHTDAREFTAGAVLAHRRVDVLNRAVDTAESFYRAHQAPACFQVCDGCAPGLDDVLAARAYVWTAPISLEVGPAQDISSPRHRRGIETEITTWPTTDWFAVETSADRSHDVARERSLLRRIRQPSTYVTVYERGRPIAIGRSVAERGWAGVFDMLTDPLHRGHGAARLVLSTLARAALDRGASWLYLQLERGNDRARRLYRSNGFREAATYHYRVQDDDPTA